MKNLLYIFILIPIIGFTQEDKNPPFKRQLIDSIHSKRLCVEYPGLSRFLTTKEAYDESEYVFTGKVTKIIRTEQLEPQDYGRDENGNSLPLYIEPTYQYWYILKTNKIYKGKKSEYIKIHSKTFSSVSPLLMLNKEYLIYALTGEFQEFPYIYCGGNSRHIENAKNELIEIEKIIKK
jgi:hypothetical protein